MPAVRDMYSRAAWTIGFALVVYYNSRVEYPGPAARLTVVLILIGLGFAAAGYLFAWIGGPGRQRVQEQILGAMDLQGSERLLDASEGPSLGIAAAKRLKSGKVVALGDSSTNEASRQQAKLDGVGEKIRFEPGDLKKLSYPDANFDVVLSSGALSALGDIGPAIGELVRVLKPGGRLAIHATGDAVHYQNLLSAAGLSSVTTLPAVLPFGLGGRVISARK